MASVSGAHKSLESRTRNAVEASLNYIAESSERQVYYVYEPPPRTPKITGEFVPRTVAIRNWSLIGIDRIG
jgi:hypothetical protein